MLHQKIDYKLHCIQVSESHGNQAGKNDGRMVGGATLRSCRPSAFQVRLKAGHFQYFCNFMDFAQTLMLNISFSRIFAKKGPSSL